MPGRSRQKRDEELALALAQGSSYTRAAEVVGCSVSRASR